MKQLIGSLIVLLLPYSIFAQVTIAPTNLFIDDGERFATYMVINGSEQNQEISIEFIFGYSQSDENGFRSNVYSDTTLAKKYSIAPFIRAFPQSFIISPGKRQIVRLRISEPKNLDDGTYWARIKTSVIPESPPVEINNEENVVARIGINIEQITGLFYKKGSTTTGIEINNIKSEFEESKLIILTNLDRTGNSPFLGSISTLLKDKNGNEIASNSVSTSIYFDGVHRQELILPDDIEPGEYDVEIRFETSRSDISSDDLVQMEPVTATTTVTIP